MRKADDRRKRARESKAERQAAAAAARQEEVRRLKAIKRREIEERCARSPSALAVLGAMCRAAPGWMHLGTRCAPRPGCGATAHAVA